MGRRTISDEEIIQALKDWAAKHGRPPKAPEWEGGQFCTAATVRRHFGSWGAGLRAAGMEPLGGGRSPYTREQIIAELQAWAERHGRTPTSKDWSRAGAPMAATTVLTHFRHWSKAIEAADLPPVPYRRSETVDSSVLAEAFDRSGRSLSDVARDMGYTRQIDGRPHGDTTVIKRLMGRAHYNAGPGYERTFRRFISFDVAERFVRACGVDPVDVGL